MDRGRLIYHLENWRDWMKRDSNKLGYPSRSLMLVGDNGYSEETWDDMCEECDSQSARTIDTLIDDLKGPYKVAINHTWLGVEKCWPTHDMDLELAYEVLEIKADRKGLV